MISRRTITTGRIWKIIFPSNSQIVREVITGCLTLRDDRLGAERKEKKSITQRPLCENEVVAMRCRVHGPTVFSCQLKWWNEFWKVDIFFFSGQRSERRQLVDTNSIQNGERVKRVHYKPHNHRARQHLHVPFLFDSYFIEPRGGQRADLST